MRFASKPQDEPGLAKEEVTVKGDELTARNAGRDLQRNPDQPADFAINAKVRQVLARRWVQSEGLEVGTTDGVVLLKGRVEREPGGGSAAGDGVARDRFLWRLRSELRAIPGVVEVVMDMADTERTDRS